MRKLTDHKQNEANEQITIEVRDAPGHGGACHDYVVVVPPTNRPDAEPIVVRSTHRYHIEFQNGPIKEVGVNGITHEVLLAILIDRLRGFQSGNYICRENALALTKMEEALMWLHKRTQGREVRGVEGTHEI